MFLIFSPAKTMGIMWNCEIDMIGKILNWKIPSRVRTAKVFKEKEKK